MSKKQKDIESIRTAVQKSLRRIDNKKYGVVEKGARFGTLEVIDEIKKPYELTKKWLCKCEKCHQSFVATSEQLRNSVRFCTCQVRVKVKD